MNKKYIISVSVLTFILPLFCASTETFFYSERLFSFELFGKWFIFSAVGLRLFFAGIKQTTNPAFTAREIFGINNAESFPILRELGYANLSFGLIGIVSLLFSQWRIVSAFGSGLYFGIAGFQHLFKKLASTNETFAMVTDILIFMLLLIYFVRVI